VSTLQWLQLVMAATFVVAGLIAWRCRPGNRIGPIMAIYGSMVLAGYFLQKAHAPALITLGLLVADGSAFAFVYLLLAFPSGPGRPICRMRCGTRSATRRWRSRSGCPSTRPTPTSPATSTRCPRRAPASRSRCSSGATARAWPR